MKFLFVLVVLLAIGAGVWFFLKSRKLKAKPVKSVPGGDKLRYTGTVYEYKRPASYQTEFKSYSAKPAVSNKPRKTATETSDSAVVAYDDSDYFSSFDSYSTPDNSSNDSDRSSTWTDSSPTSSYEAPSSSSSSYDSGSSSSYDSGSSGSSDSSSY